MNSANTNTALISLTNGPAVNVTQMLAQSFLLRWVLPEMVLLKRARKSFFSNKLTIMGAGSEKPCTTNGFTSKNSFTGKNRFIKETTFPSRNVWRIGPSDSNKNCFCKIILKAFILFTLRKRLWR